jgi:hypothetical protein
VLALRFNKDADNTVGVYGVFRNQRNVNATDGGKATDVFVVDAAGRWEFLQAAHPGAQGGLRGLDHQRHHHPGAQRERGAAARAAVRRRRQVLNRSNRLA